VRRFFLILVTLGVFVVPAADAVPIRRADAGHGLAIVLPHGWRLAHARVATCSDPVQRLLAVEGRVRLHLGMNVPAGAALVLVQESRSGKFPSRPAHFALGSTGEMGGCCEMPTGRGAQVVFRDHGRRFYAFVYATSRAQRNEALALLDSLRVSPEAGAGA
jgi:hypothetical protein